MKAKKIDFKVSIDDQDVLYREYETGSYDIYLDKLKFIKVEVCRKNEVFSRPYYLYNFTLDSVAKRNVILDFGSRLLESSAFALAKHDYLRYIALSSFARKLLKSLI